MKIIDLLNKIANGEEVPKKIKYTKRIGEYLILELKENDYIDIDGDCLFEDYDWLNNLNEEVEIIEEDNKDKEIEVYINGEKVDITDIYEPLKQGEYFYKENDKWYVHKLKYVSKIIEEDKKIEKLKHAKEDDILVNGKSLLDKIDEIIDKLNKGD